MPEEKKRLVTATSKALIFVAAIGWVVAALLFFSGFKKVNAYLLLAAFCFAAILIYIYIKKPKAYDLHKIVSDISTRYHAEQKEFLDTREFQATPLTNELLLVYFPKEGKTFYYDRIKKIVTGVETNHPYPMLKRNEKSKIFEAIARTAGTEAKVKAAASALNVDVEDLGL